MQRLPPGRITLEQSKPAQGLPDDFGGFGVHQVVEFDIVGRPFHRLKTALVELGFAHVADRVAGLAEHPIQQASDVRMRVGLRQAQAGREDVRGPRGLIAPVRMARRERDAEQFVDRHKVIIRRFREEIRVAQIDAPPEKGHTKVELFQIIEFATDQMRVDAST